MGRNWPGDAMLSSQSADRLVDWLKKNGINGPAEELEMSRRSKTAPPAN